MNKILLHKLLSLRGFLPEVAYFSLKALFFRNLWSQELKLARRMYDADHAEIHGSERATLIENLVEAYPFTSVLELGCAYGKNFHILAPLFPDVKFVGLDADSDILEGANSYLKERGINNAELKYGKIEDLSKIPDNSYDIVLTCASLLYVSDQSIEKVILDMLRISNKDIFILEQQVSNKYYEKQHLGVFHKGLGSDQGYWQRDYLKLLQFFIDPKQVKYTKVPSPIWPTEEWSTYAGLIKISKIEAN